jgi:hypothetical protein
MFRNASEYQVDYHLRREHVKEIPAGAGIPPLHPEHNG